MIVCKDYCNKILSLLAGVGAKFLNYKVPPYFFVDYIDAVMKHFVSDVCSKYCSRNVAILLHAGVHINGVNEVNKVEKVRECVFIFNKKSDFE